MDNISRQGKRILLVEDEPHIARAVVFNLEEEGYQVSHVETGEEALELFTVGMFSLVILDLMLPGINGIEVCDKIRTNDPRIPILMLTARAEEEYRVSGLQTGADDYMTKPFSLSEFILRVNRMVERYGWYQQNGGASTSERFIFGGNTIDFTSGMAITERGEIQLTDLEVKLLKTFVERIGETVSREELLADAWGFSPDAETRTLDNFMVRLRRYFEKDPSSPQHFITVRGRGYRFNISPSNHEVIAKGLD